MISKTNLAIIGGFGIGCLIFYAYFERKRRNSNKFSKVVKPQEDDKPKDLIKGPSFNNPESFHEYYIQEIELGEDSLDSGRTEDAIEHFANALAVCKIPNEVLKLLKMKANEKLVSDVLAKMPIALKRIQDNVINRSTSQ